MPNPISQLLQESIDAGDLPSAVYLVAEKGEIVFHEALGHAVVEPERIEAQRDTIYDLASLTKPLVTGLLLAKMLERQELHLDQTLGELFPCGNFSDKESIPLKDLLTHTSRLPAWLPFYLLTARPAEVTAKILEQPLNGYAKQVTYSDLNFLLLAAVITDLRNSSLDDTASTEIFKPLGLVDTGFDPDTALRKRIAASENGNVYEKQTCIELGYLGPDQVEKNLSAFREYQIWGEVHDGNAWFMGGVAGHAGLFSTGEEVFRIAQQFLPNYTALLKPETCELFRTNFTPGMNEDRSLAFQLASTKDSTAGTKMPPESFGHLGFTGTSVWIDPVKERVFILLTNRTHNHPPPFANINSLRRRFHDLAIGLLDKQK
jgi:CubicO group peptidase (beta-lactamase class C family)